MVMLVAEVVEDVLEPKLSGTAKLPASPTSAMMPGYDPAAPAPMVVAVVRLKPLSGVEPPNVQVLLVGGVAPKPPGSVPVKHHW
jgi:hypothetical protein